jgi:adenylate cyclase
VQEAELARRAHATHEQVEEWVRLGLIKSSEDYGVDALERARLLQLAVSRGLTAEAIAAASDREGDILSRFVDFVAPVPGDVLSIEEAAAGTELDPVFVRRLRTAGGLAETEVGPEDLEAMKSVRLALDTGMPEVALLQLVRVLADALGRVAEAEIRLFHIYVHDRMRAHGVPPEEVARTTAAATEALIGLLEPSVLYFHRKAWARAMREDVLGHLADTLAPAGPAGQMEVAVLFVDLASFTPLTEAMGDEAAADVLDRFSELIRDQALHCDGRVVKQIGDEFMLVFPTGAGAVRYAIGVADAALREQHFPALRMGAHAGSALYREGDYMGATVNMAARVAAQAQRGQLLVTRRVAEAHVEVPVAWRPIGARTLKGVGEPIDLFELSFGSHAKRQTDPVCGMDLDPDADTVKTEHADQEFVFCSESCRERFRADPPRYRGTGSDPAPTKRGS